MKFENKLFILVMILHVSTIGLALFQIRAAMYISLAAFIVAVLGWNYSVTLEQRRK